MSEEADRMEPLFTNKCTFSKKLYREAMLNYNRRTRLFSIVVIILLLVYFLAACIIYDIWSDMWFVLGMFILSSTFYIAVPLISANLTYKRNFELYQQEPSSVIEFFEDRMTSTAYPSNAQITTRYDQIKRVISSRQLYLLVIRYHMFHLIDKNGFDKINMLEFERFIREKAPKAKFWL